VYSQKGPPNFRCFSLVSFDFMIDRDLQPWLIEINSDISLIGGSFQRQIIDEMFLIEIDGRLPPKFPVSGNLDESKFVEVTTRKNQDVF
jgi:hypothetical protein